MKRTSTSGMARRDTKLRGRDLLDPASDAALLDRRVPLTSVEANAPACSPEAQSVKILPTRCCGRACVPVRAIRMKVATIKLS
jgi:hypothetical protein